MSDRLRMLDQYKGCKIAIYGLGTETEKTLSRIGNLCEVAGLLDGYREEGTLYGKQIISFQKAVESGVKLILVAARPGSCKAIAKRIGEACAANQIQLMDIRGKNLCEQQEAKFDLTNLPGQSRKELLETVLSHDVLSVDLFDTLIMRNTLFGTDIFEMVDIRLQNRGILIKDFCGRRMNSEKYLSEMRAPTLPEIYEHMIQEYHLQGISSEELAELEWEIDRSLLVPRNEMCSFVEEVYRTGRKVYIVTDTYYSREQIKKMLDKCGIAFYTDVLVSCEYGKGKTQGLFELLKDRTEGRRIHIGDDVYADIDSAVKCGLSAEKIYSGMDLFEAVGYFGMWDHIKSLSDRIKAGLFVAKLFNSPFQFETSDRRITINNAYDIGYLLFAPMITDFVIWFREEVQKRNINNIWFCARDGYLIKKLYEKLTGDNETTYFLTSRIAAIRAGTVDEKDISYVGKMRFSGTLSDQLYERYGIETSGSQPELDSRDSLMDYSADILSKANICRQNYQKYIDKLEMKDGEIAFFDFVAKGTCQLFMGHIIPNHLIGMYFMQQDKEDAETGGLDIVSFYDSVDIESSAIFNDYYILEIFLTSDMPTFMEFDECGNALYTTETRTSDDIECIRTVQKGVEGYFENYLQLIGCGQCAVNKKLDEQMLLLIHGADISQNELIQLKVEDRFFNRTTELTSLV